MEVKTGTGQLIKTPQTPHERPRLINRYYEPTSAQFLTVDPAYALTLSVYGYVNNDPLNFTDPSRAFALTLLGGPIGAVVGTTIGTVSYLANHGSHGFSARGLAGAAVGGFVGGGIAGACDGSTGVLVACGALGRAAGEFTGELISGDRLSVQRIGVAGLFGGVGGGISGRIVPTVGFKPYKLSNVYHPGPNAGRTYLDNFANGLLTTEGQTVADSELASGSC